MDLAIGEPTLNKRMAVIQQVLVCPSSAQSSFKSRVELHFEDWRGKIHRGKKQQFNMLGINTLPVLLLYSMVGTKGREHTLTQRP